MVKMILATSAASATGQAVVCSVLNSFCFVFFPLFFLLCLLVYFWFYFEKWHKMPSSRSEECEITKLVVDFARKEWEMGWLRQAMDHGTIEINVNFENNCISNAYQCIKVAGLNQFCILIGYFERKKWCTFQQLYWLIVAVLLHTSYWVFRHKSFVWLMSAN